jgi:hypothetical protein
LGAREKFFVRPQKAQKVPKICIFLQKKAHFSTKKNKIALLRYFLAYQQSFDTLLTKNGWCHKKLLALEGCKKVKNSTNF